MPKLLTPPDAPGMVPGMWCSPSYKTAVDLQKVIGERVRNEPPKASKDIAALARALVDLEEMKRKIRMKPLPRAIDVTKHGKPKTSTPTALPEPEE